MMKINFFIRLIVNNKLHNKPDKSKRKRRSGLNFSLTGAAFGAIGASFSNLTIAGLIGGLGTSFLSNLVNYATASSCSKELSCK